jgi:predicted PhzF superfamily epimerase YddE/YHI9
VTDYAYRIVDVFTERPLEGNSLAVHDLTSRREGENP